MKRRTVKPSEQVMRFFTPELYVRFNSTAAREADRANEEWEAAIETYNNHLGKLRDQLPPEAQKLAEVSLHDAELRAIEEEHPFGLSANVPRGGLCAAVAIVSLKQDGDILSLIYFLWDKVREHATKKWPFSKRRPHWLYDEIDVARPGQFLHRVLISDGRVIEVPFVSVMIHRLPLRASDEIMIAKQSA